LVFFAAVQLYREHQRNARATRGAIAATSARAFLLRRSLLGWVGRTKSDGDDFERWIYAALHDRRFHGELSDAINCVRDMLAATADLDDRRANSIRRCLVLLVEGMRRVTRYATEPMPRGIEVFEWVELRTQAEEDIRDAIRILENDVIEPYLLNEEGAQQRLRESTSFDATLGALAQGLLNQERERQDQLEAREEDTTAQVEREGKRRRR
jgi:hypothetical protein